MSSANLPVLRTALTEEMQALQSTVDAFDEAAARTLGVTRTDLRCVEILLRQDAASPGQLGPALGLTSGGVTAMLARLERLGYLVRTADPADGRRVVVRITAAARRKAWELYGPIAEEGAGTISGYSAPELSLLAGFLRDARELYERHLARVRNPQLSRRH